jgi:pimeloyl-ACP methyl ester carboxylesterase
MTTAMFSELVAVVALANETNRLANGYRIRRRRGIPESARALTHAHRHDRRRTPRTSDAASIGARAVRVGRLPLDAVHTMHWERCGNAAGVPLVFLHGGRRRVPATPSPLLRSAFLNIILYDQRGHAPHRGIADRQYDAASHQRSRAPPRMLKIDRWLHSAVPQGSTLALAYAQAHRSRARSWCCAASSSPPHPSSTGSCTASGRSSRSGAFARLLPQRERTDLLGSYYRRLSDADRRHLPARTRGIATKARARRCCRPDAMTKF